MRTTCAILMLAACDAGPLPVCGPDPSPDPATVVHVTARHDLAPSDQPVQWDFELRSTCVTTMTTQAPAGSDVTFEAPSYGPTIVTARASGPSARTTSRFDVAPGDHVCLHCSTAVAPSSITPIDATLDADGRHVRWSPTGAAPGCLVRATLGWHVAEEVPHWELVVPASWTAVEVPTDSTSWPPDLLMLSGAQVECP